MKFKKKTYSYAFWSAVYLTLVSIILLFLVPYIFDNISGTLERIIAFFLLFVIFCFFNRLLISILVGVIVFFKQEK